MLIAQLPSDEDLRLIDLASYDLLDTPPEKAFDELVELACQLFDCPVSLITLLDENRQWFKSKRGIEDTETPREYSFCSHAILGDDVMIVNDARKDERFADNPLVSGKLQVGFYAGAAIISPAGHKLGTICIIDHKPKKLTAIQARALTILSNQVTLLLELRARNKMIEQRANELLNLKNDIISHIIKEQDADKQFIATELHENLAQTLAASRMYLNVAEKNEDLRLSLVKKTNDQLGELLVKMRSLSNAIIPSTHATLPLEDLLHDYIQKNNYSFFIKINCTGATGDIKVELSIACLRILQKWLKVLEEKGDVSKVQISIMVDNEIKIIIKDDGRIQNFRDIEQEVITSMVYGRVYSLGGDLTFSFSGESGIEITLPQI